jgi:ribosome maturation factor RimP
MKKTINELQNDIEKVIEPVINALGIELDYIEFSMMKGKALLRVYIDKENGVNIDDCTQVSREIEAVLDVEDPIPYSYVLEVSSPGLDRPLKGIKDFKRYSGNMVRVVTNDPVEGETFFIGKLVEAGDDEVVLLLPGDMRINIRYDNISRARLEVEV